MDIICGGTPCLYCNYLALREKEAKLRICSLSRSIPSVLLHRKIPKDCPVCFRRIRFSVPVIRCNNCNLNCHHRCWRDVAYLCRGPTSASQEVTESAQDERNAANFVSCFQSKRISTSSLPFIPMTILRLVNEIELNIQPGLYCLPAPDKSHVVESIINNLREGKVKNLKIYDVHTLTACLKQVLMSRDIIPVWHITKKDLTYDYEIEFDELPIPNKQTMAFVALHLKLVATNPTSRMTLQMLARTFTPVLMKEINETSVRALFKLLQNETNFFISKLCVTSN